MAEAIREPNPTSSTLSSSRSRTCSMHRFVNEREVESILRWSDQVPVKTFNSNPPTTSDPAVQAYIEAKMALLRSHAPTKG